MLTFNTAQLEGEFIFLGNACHRTVAEFASSSGDATVAAVAIAAGGGTGDGDIGSGNVKPQLHCWAVNRWRASKVEVLENLRTG